MIRVAVLRVAQIGKIHASNLATHSRAILVADADPFGGGAPELRRRLGCDISRGAEATIARDDADAFVTGTTADPHVDIPLLAAREGDATDTRGLDRAGSKSQRPKAIARFDWRRLIGLDRRREWILFDSMRFRVPLKKKGAKPLARIAEKQCCDRDRLAPVDGAFALKQVQRSSRACA